MAHETSKQAIRRGADRRYATRWFVGAGIDIGCGEDSLGNLSSFFPLMTDVRGWDLPDGDAMLMAGIEDASFDFVHSSHCLEHLRDPSVALANWIRICRVGGHIVVTIPDEDLYEQGVWPSTFNPDHKSTFTIAKAASWSPASVNVFDLLAPFLGDVSVLKVELLDSGFQYGLPRSDQSRGTLSESAIEIVLRKTPQATGAGGGGGGGGGLKRDRASDGSTEAMRSRDALHRAIALEGQGRYGEAQAALRHAIADDPRCTEAHYRLGKLCELDDETEAAIAHFDTAILHDPDGSQAHVARGFGRLKLGDYAAGGEGVRWIWRGIGGIRTAPFVQADGARPDLSGQTVVISADAGLGDALQFVRYGHVLGALGARVVVECQPELVRLFAQDDRFAHVAAIGQPLPPFDHRAPMHDLIRLFGTTPATIPATVPYLVPPREAVAAWSERLRGARPGLKVGLVWAGNPAHVHDGRRSIRFDLLAPLLACEGVTFVSLQKGSRQVGLLDWTDELSDMAETAALVAGLDLVIAIDTAVAHLAGALGVPVWLLNRFDGCWRWMKGRGDSPWYPTMRQFRQASPGDWRGVIAAVNAALAEAATAATRPRPARAKRPRAQTKAA